jgi:hypothetical protein
MEDRMSRPLQTDMNRATMRTTPPSDTEPWWTCTLEPVEPDGGPTITMRFVELTDPQEFVLYGINEINVDPRDPRELERPPQNFEIRELVAFERTARNTLEFLTTDTPPMKGPAPGSARRELTADFLADIVRRHRAYSEEGPRPTQRLARDEHVGLSTVKNWLAKAKEAGIEA